MEHNRRAISLARLESPDPLRTWPFFSFPPETFRTPKQALLGSTLVLGSDHVKRWIRLPPPSLIP